MYTTGWWRKDPSATCTVEELIDIISEPNNGTITLPTDAYNEVYRNIYISDSSTALSTIMLRNMGMTHVVNAAMGKDRMMGLVNTTQSYYNSSNIKFFGVEAIDVSPFRLERYFHQTADFIDEALSDDGCVLVHCQQGVSRSTTLVLAYLMIKKNMSVQQAMKQVRKHRDILPNDGFLKQLCDLNDQLFHKHDRRIKNY
ncbi:DUSP3 (predicted) [Pycnogonum litorale]